MSQQLNHLPHPIRPIVHYESSLAIYWPYALAALLILLFVALIFFWWRKKRRSLVIPPKEALIDRLNRELNELSPTIPFEGKACEDYFYRLSLLFRQIIEEVSEISATDLTLKELKVALVSPSFTERSKAHEMMSFFERADMIKFAKVETSLEEAKLSTKNVRYWTRCLLANQLASAQIGESSENTMKNSKGFKKEVSHQL
ncbi:MAG: hypothetical protein R3B45_05305 [Bdellovibrionota bacterium]